MNTYLIKARSDGNMFAVHTTVKAKDLTECQDKFFGWLKTQEVYQHLWQLTFNIELISEIE